MRRLSTFLLFLFSTFSMQAQYIPDKAFFQLTFKPCFQEKVICPLYKKLEVDPQLTSMSKQQFQDYLTYTIKGLGLRSTQQGVFKLRLNFYLDATICLKVLGEKDILLTPTQIRYFRERMDNFTNFQFGQHRGVNQHSQGILYVYITNGQLKNFRNVNFEFLKNLSE